MRARRQEGFGGECRLALHLVFFLRLFRTIFSFLRNCAAFWLKFELFSLKILNHNCAFAPLGARIGRTAAGGVEEGRRPPSLFAFGLCRNAIFSRGVGKEKKKVRNRRGSFPPIEPRTNFGEPRNNPMARSGPLPLQIKSLRECQNGFARKTPPSLEATAEVLRRTDIHYR